MSIWAGGSVEASSIRGAVLTPARIGSLVEALSPGVAGRWDEVNAVVLRVEGAAPSGLGEEAVLAGANAVAIKTTAGWEVVQFRQAALIGPQTWRLTGLLRAQRGTEAEMAAGGAAGAVVVFLDESLPRADAMAGERGLPMIWSAGPRGGPAGGAGVTRRDVTLRGTHNRPFSPAHLRVTAEGGGRRVRWIARTRTGGDVWEGEPVASDPLTFRIRVLDDGLVRRAFEVDGTDAVYADTDIAADFPAGFGVHARVGVAQSDGRMGWGSESLVELMA